MMEQQEKLDLKKKLSIERAEKKRQEKLSNDFDKDDGHPNHWDAETQFMEQKLR